MTAPPRTVYLLGVDREQLRPPIDPAFIAFFSARRRDGLQVAFEIRGFEDDPRELYEIDEVRTWMHMMFVLAMPEALSTLARSPNLAGLYLATACCNRAHKHDLGVSVELSSAWIDACAQVGVQPL